MEMTAAQIRGAMMSHKKRIKELKEHLGYPDNHPLITMHLNHLASLEQRLNTIYKDPNC